MQDFGGFYDREKLFWKQIKVVYPCVCICIYVCWMCVFDDCVCYYVCATTVPCLFRQLCRRTWPFVLRVLHQVEDVTSSHHASYATLPCSASRHHLKCPSRESFRYVWRIGWIITLACKHCYHKWFTHTLLVFPGFSLPSSPAYHAGDHYRVLCWLPGPCKGCRWCHCQC